MTRIVQYRLSKGIAAANTFVAPMLCVLGIFYDRHNENESIFVYGYDGDNVIFF